ncbi:unnamed protein product [Brassica rapa subsp. narinosa]
MCPPPDCRPSVGASAPKGTCRWLSPFGGSTAGFLLCLLIPWLCVHPWPRLQFWLDRTHSFRISPNPGTKSVKENATKQPAFANPETVFVRKQSCNVKSKTTLGNGYLGSRIDEERSEMRYLSLNASCAPSLLAEGTSAWVSQIVVPPSSRGYGTEADLPCVTARGWPKSELRTSEAS